MPENITVQKLLHNTKLMHEYQRMAVLDSRIPEVMEELLPFADELEPRTKEPVLIVTLREATKSARTLFKKEDPEIASSLASTAYLNALTDLRERLANGKSG